MDQNRIAKRIQITLSPDLYALLIELKKKTGMSVSGFIDDTMCATMPQIRAIIDAHEAVGKNKEDAVRVMSDSLKKASDDLAKLSYDFDSQASKSLPKKAPKKAPKKR